MDLSWVHVWRGADRVVARLQHGQLGEQQSGGHLDGGELLQNLHQCWIVVPLPLLILLQALGCQGERQSGIKVQVDIYVI